MKTVSNNENAELSMNESSLKNESRPGTPIFVHNFLDEYGLNPYEFRIYAHVVRRTGGKLNGECFARLKKTAEICDMSVRKAQYSFKFLCEAKFLIQDKREGRTDVYKLAPTSEWESKENLASIRERVMSRKKNNGQEN